MGNITKEIALSHLGLQEPVTLKDCEDAYHSLEEKLDPNNYEGHPTLQQIVEKNRDEAGEMICYLREYFKKQKKSTSEEKDLFSPPKAKKEYFSLDSISKKIASIDSPPELTTIESSNVLHSQESHNLARLYREKTKKIFLFWTIGSCLGILINFPIGVWMSILSFWLIVRHFRSNPQLRSGYDLKNPNRLSGSYDDLLKEYQDTCSNQEFLKQKQELEEAIQLYLTFRSNYSDFRKEFINSDYQSSYREVMGECHITPEVVMYLLGTDEEFSEHVVEHLNSKLIFTALDVEEAETWDMDLDSVPGLGIIMKAWATAVFKEFSYSKPSEREIEVAYKIHIQNMIEIRAKLELGPYTLEGIKEKILEKRKILIPKLSEATNANQQALVDYKHFKNYGFLYRRIAIAVVFIFCCLVVPSK